MASIFGSGLVLILVSHIFPNKTPFDWELYKTKITTSDEHVRTSSPSLLPPGIDPFGMSRTGSGRRAVMLDGLATAV